MNLSVLSEPVVSSGFKLFILNLHIHLDDTVHHILKNKTAKAEMEQGAPFYPFFHQMPLHSGKMIKVFSRTF